MILTLLILKFALSVVFGVAGVTKLLDSDGVREAVTNFGVPVVFARVVAVILPLVELVIAVGLVLPPLTRPSALAALFLLVGFTIAIGANLLRGRAPDCHCFGQLYSRPLGWPTLLRNVAFACCAAFIYWQPESVKGRDVGTPGNVLSVLILSGVLVTVGALVLRLSRNKNRLDHDHKSSGLPVNSTAPEFDLAGYEGGTGSLAKFLSYGKPLMLIFTNPNCGPCVSLFHEVANWQRDHADVITISIITQGTVKENFVNISRNGLQHVLLQEQREVAEAYHSTATPSAVIVSLEQKVASPLAAGADEIRKLLHDTLPSLPKLELSHSIGERALRV